MSGKKRSTINSIINRKIDKWIDSIKDERLKRKIKSKIIVTGGCITSMLLGEKINDFDIYFMDKDIAAQVAQYYVSDGMEVRVEEDRVSIFIQSAGVAKRKKKGDYSPLFFSSNAITLSNKIQLILRFCGDVEEIHANFDFVHATNYWTNETGVVFKEEALLATLSKNLVYSGSRYPICSIFRAKKFIKRGWKINAGQYLKMAFQISDLNLYDVAVLEDQLIGVDTAYFAILIETIRKNNTENKRDYVLEVINRMFG